ncbi:MarR family transcriptional regulator [Streptomyces sp. N2-109]|uniref:MarR family transcriptional regulator n=1 Tax=Streptomyces gossypii TaxID=2883101 RepID=A0ABT2JSY1_9ACTN|nr:MarR family transcriptional regulator [Streptomyces gossypii]MCT2590997.1 MarR family transcriptional regulator [Streptomyces gossypii]
MATHSDAAPGYAVGEDPLFLVTLPASVRGSYPFLLRKASQRITERAHEALSPFNLTLRHFGVLNLVDLEEGQIQRAIGAKLGIDRTTIVTLADDLERAGLLERRRGQDRRSFALYLTPQGVAQLRQLRRLIELVQEEFLEPLSTTERETLRELLLRLL